MGLHLLPQRMGGKSCYKTTMDALTNQSSVRFSHSTTVLSCYLLEKYKNTVYLGNNDKPQHLFLQQNVE